MPSQVHNSCSWISIHDNWYSTKAISLRATCSFAVVGSWKTLFNGITKLVLPVKYSIYASIKPILEWLCVCLPEVVMQDYWMRHFTVQKRCAWDFSSAVSGFCQVFIVTRAKSLWSAIALMAPIQSLARLNQLVQILDKTADWLLTTTWGTLNLTDATTGWQE